jgi:hypothetical protein
MACNDKGAGPQLAQPVLYNNAGVITSAIIFAINTNGTVGLVFFGSSSPATPVASSSFGPNPGQWSYPQFF